MCQSKVLKGLQFCQNSYLPLGSEILGKWKIECCFSNFWSKKHEDLLSASTWLKLTQFKYFEKNYVISGEIRDIIFYGGLVILKPKCTKLFCLSLNVVNNYEDARIKKNFFSTFHYKYKMPANSVKIFTI